MTWVKTICIDDFLQAVKLSSSIQKQCVRKDSLDDPVSDTDSTGTIPTLHAQAQEEIQSHLRGLVSKIDKDVQELLQAMQDEMPSLVIKLLKKVLGAYAIDASMIHSILQDALKEVSEDNAYVEVFISQQDWDTLKIDDADWAHSYPKVSFFRDEKLKSGDCLLKSRFGLIDGRLEKKVLKIEKELAVS